MFFCLFVSSCILCFIERPEMCCQSFVSCLTNSKFRNGAGQGVEGSQGSWSERRRELKTHSVLTKRVKQMCLKMPQGLFFHPA